MPGGRRRNVSNGGVKLGLQQTQHRELLLLALSLHYRPGDPSLLPEQPPKQTRSSYSRQGVASSMLKSTAEPCPTSCEGQPSMAEKIIREEDNTHRSDQPSHKERQPFCVRLSAAHSKENLLPRHCQAWVRPAIPEQILCSHNRPCQSPPRSKSSFPEQAYQEALKAPIQTHQSTACILVPSHSGLRLGFGTDSTAGPSLLTSVCAGYRILPLTSVLGSGWESA